MICISGSPKGQFCSLGNTWQSRDIFGCHSWRWEDATGILWVEARGAAKHPSVREIALPQQRITQPNMSMVPRSRHPGPSGSSQLKHHPRCCLKSLLDFTHQGSGPAANCVLVLKYLQPLYGRIILPQHALPCDFLGPMD